MSRAGMAPRWRKRLLIVPACLALLAAGIKVATMYAFATVGADAYDDARYDASESSFRRLEVFNVIDPSLALVGVGDARYRQGDLLGAEDAFAAALQRAPGDCEIRFNLAVTVEAQGDLLWASAEGEAAIADADPAGRYNVALGVAEGHACPSDVADDAGARLAATRERIIAKLDRLAGQDRQDREDQDVSDPGNRNRGDSEVAGLTRPARPGVSKRPRHPPATRAPARTHPRAGRRGRSSLCRR